MYLANNRTASAITTSKAGAFTLVPGVVAVADGVVGCISGINAVSSGFIGVMLVDTA